MMFGEVRVVEDVPEAFARLVASTFEAIDDEAIFRLGCSGGSSGARCFGRLAKEDLEWGRVACYFADERCVDPDSPDANSKAIGDALGQRKRELAGFYAMSCAEGPAAYEARLRKAGGFDLLQLGVGPDGHTASLFPGATGPDLGSETLVITNADPNGRNPHPRMSLTYSAIATASVVAITAIGPDKAEVLSEVAGGADLPIGRVRAPKVIWLADQDAASKLNWNNRTAST
jgi:6-phosphogluconolactonase